MKSRQEQIREIKETLLRHQPIINVPYEKINDIAVVLGKEGYGNISEYKAEIERLNVREEHYKLICDVTKATKKQAKIDVLNEIKKKTHNYYPSIDSYCISQHVVLVRDIDELIKEIQNEN